MRFIRVHGRVIPIQDHEVKHSNHERMKDAAVSATAALGGGGTTYGLAKLSQQSAHKAERLNKLSAESTKFANKSSKRLQKMLTSGKGSEKLKERVFLKVAHSIRKSEKLSASGAKTNLKSVSLKRGAFVFGGLALGHAFTKGIEAVTGKEANEKSVLGAHAAGFSTAAIASTVIKSVKSKSKLAKAYKVLSMARGLKI